MAARLKLSVIIPVGPGETAWPALLADLRALSGSAEVLLVAVAGQAPRDFATADHGLAAPVRWLEAPAGRARQQNAGAAAARGDALWFLHADTGLPPASVALAEATAGRDALAFFQLRFRDDGPRLARLNALGAAIRSRWLGLPFGDQGFLLPRARFEQLGRFDERLERGEDHALVWAARRAGLELLALGAPVWTSARRYRERGWLRTTAEHARLTVAQVQRFRRGGQGGGRGGEQP